MKNVILALFSALTLSANAAEIRIVNELQQPIAGAEILIGQALNDPFPENLLKTDVNGALKIPAEWDRALPITIEANGYLRTTFIGVLPANRTFQLHRSDSREFLEVSGKTSHYQGIKKDGKVDFGLIFPALSRRQLLQFDVSTMISPEVDTIKILTEKFNIPSNIAFPKQTENYVLPITIDKANYRMFLKQPGNYRMVAAHGQFPLKQVISELTDGKSFFDVLNLFTFFGGGQRDIQVNATVKGQDIAVNQVPFDSTVNVMGPAFVGNNVVVSIPLTDQGGVFFPSDLKSIGAGETVAMKVPQAAASDRYILSLMMSKDEADMMVTQPESLTDELKLMVDRLLNPADIVEGAVSLTWQSASSDDAVVPEFMSLVNRPNLTGSHSLELNVPVASPLIRPVATYVILSEVEKPPRGQYGAEKRFRLWEVFADGWVDKIELPPLFNNIQPGKTYRWEVLFLGADANTTSQQGYFLDEVTHLSRNSLDF